MQKLSGDAATALVRHHLRYTVSAGLRSTGAKSRNATRVTPAFSQYRFRNTGKPRPAKDAVKTTTRRKSSEWSALEKPAAPLTESAACREIPLLKFGLVLEFPPLPPFGVQGSGFRLRAPSSLTPANRLNSGAGEGIRTPDPLITNQMLYRLSYASTPWDGCAFAQTNPSDPFQMSGTIS